MTLNGGTHVSDANFWGSIPRGIEAQQADLILDDVVLNQFRNYVVTTAGGTLLVRNAELQTQTYYMHQTDIGFQLNSTDALFDGLSSISGFIDHTVNINNPPADFAAVTVVNSEIQGSGLSWGDCVRAYTNTTLVVSNNRFFRDRGGAAGTSSGVSLNGPWNTVSISGNLFEGLPRGVHAYGSFSGSNSIVIEGNTFHDSEDVAVLINNMSYEGVDLGGGSLGSSGGNEFTGSTANGYDVELFDGPADVFAMGNTWSDPNRSLVIWDRDDEAALGRVIVEPAPVVPLVSGLGRALLSGCLIATAIAASRGIVGNRSNVR
jgi:hypothetical protein